MVSALSTLTLLVGIVQISPTECQFQLLQPTGRIDTHIVECKYIVPEQLLPIT